MTPPRFPSTSISAVVSDVDGTLMTDDKRLTPRAQAAVARLHARGIIFTIVSSRPPRGVRMLLDPLEIKTPVGCFNGGVIAGPDLSVITAHVLPSHVARCAVDILSARGAQSWIFAGSDWLVRDSDAPYVGLEERTVRFRPTVVQEFGSALDVAAKIVGVSADFELLARCEREVGAALAGQASVVHSQPYYLDITHPLANKGSRYRHSRRYCPFRWRRSPSSATAPMMSQCSSGAVSASRWAMPARRCSGQPIS
jgi:HAD superfamily hydrolase (TIGR01484 family)